VSLARAASTAEERTATTSPVEGEGEAPSRVAPVTPARRRLRLVRQALLEGGPGFCQFAINNACNAGCDFCSFGLDRLARGDWRFVEVGEARRAIDVLACHGVRYLVLTGGEPMLHPALLEIVGHARARAMVVILVTNGSRLSERRIAALEQAGVSSVIISIDAPSAAVHEANRHLPGVCDKIREANRIFRERRIQTTASVTMSRLIDDYGELPPFLHELGFTSVTFSYPLTTLSSSFLGHADSGLVTYTPEELIAAFDAIKALKGEIQVANPTASIEEMQRFLRGEEQRFECLGGYKYFYLDWDLALWRCHHWEEPIGSVFDFDESQRVRDGCTRCMIDCYRDASVMQHIAVSVSDAIGLARDGAWRAAATELFQRANAASIASVVEGLRWIRRI